MKFCGWFIVGAVMAVLLPKSQAFNDFYDDNEIERFEDYPNSEVRAAVIYAVNNTQIEANYPKLTLTLYNPADKTQSYPFPYADTANILKHPWFNWRLPTLIYAFGFTESPSSMTTQLIINAYIKHGGFNVLLIDWSAYNGVTAPADYFEALGNMKAIGGLIAGRLTAVFNRFYLRRMHLVGHSLGAHLCAYVNRGIPNSLFTEKIHKIVALDPAGPYMYDPTLDNKPLNGDDAEFVQVIHTDMLHAGAPFKTGTVDFYPNGGGINGIQPGCPIFNDFKLFTPTNFCSHTRSVMLYAESINSKENSFAAVKCANYSDFLFDRCYKIKQQMGFNANEHETGDFYLQTNSFAPFDRGLAGTIYYFKAP